MEIKTKMAYGNGQLVTRHMILELGKLQTRCDKYGLWLIVFVDECTTNKPITLAIYDGIPALVRLKLYSEEELLACVSEQLVMLEARYKS